MLRFIERLLEPTARSPEAAPPVLGSPQALWHFYWHFVRQIPGLLIALFVSEVAPPRIGVPLGYVVDLLAAVPSVIYGLWGVFVLVPFLTNYVWQPLSRNLAFIPLFSSFASGRDFATAGVILALMITPIIAAVSREGNFRKVFPFGAEAADVAESAFREAP